MESFRQKIKVRLRALWCMLALMLGVMAAIGVLDGSQIINSRQMDSSAASISKMLFFGSLFFLIYRIIYWRSLSRSGEKMKTRQLLENDEIRQLIRLKSGGQAMRLLIPLFMACTFVCAYISMAAFHTACAMLVLAAAVKCSLYLYYKNQFSAFS